MSNDRPTLTCHLVLHHVLDYFTADVLDELVMAVTRLNSPEDVHVYGMSAIREGNRAPNVDELLVITTNRYDISELEEATRQIVERVKDRNKMISFVSVHWYNDTDREAAWYRPLNEWGEIDKREDGDFK